MKTFLRKLLVFVILLYSVALGLQFLLTLRIRHRTVTQKDNLDLLDTRPAEMVFLGSSRCFVQFNPALFEERLGIHAVNLGVDGHSEITMHLLRLENYLSRNPAPKVAVLSLDPLVKPGSFDNNPNFTGKNWFARYAFWPSATDKPIVDYFGFTAAEKYLPLYAILHYRLLADCINLPNDQEWRRNRYFKTDLKWDTVTYPIVSLAEVNNVYFDTSAGNIREIEGRLGQLDSVCRAHSIRLVCVQTPVYKTIYDSTRFTQIKTLCDNLRISFFDLNEPSFDGNMENFYNVDHANTLGVTRMNGKLLSNPDFIRLASLR